MKIVIAPDSFKGSISSVDAARAIAQAVSEVFPDAETVVLPMADGGEGTVDAILQSTGGERIVRTVNGPMGERVEAAYGWISKEKTAVIETAAASGLPLVAKDKLNPLSASSYGTGQLIKDALDRGADRIVLGLGGSATVDAGVGLLLALGAAVYDEQGTALIAKEVGGRLSRIQSLEVGGLDPRLHKTKLVIASDVTSPLLGMQGAVYMFGPQKGVKSEELPLFEKGMQSFADVMRRASGRDCRGLPGSGAAGGIGFSLRSLLDTEFRSGLELIVELSGFEQHMKNAGLLLTGEGRIDGQSVLGKVPVGVARVAKRYSVPVIAFAGSIGKGAEQLEREGISAIVPLASGPMSLEQAMTEGEKLLYEAAVRALKLIELGINTGRRT